MIEKLTREEREAAERKRRRQIAFIMRMREQEGEKKPLQRTLGQTHDLNKIREARRERRDG